MLTVHASALKRVMNCNGSRLMAGALLPVISGGEEGEAAKWAASAILKGTNGQSLVGMSAPNGVFITDEILTAVEEYVSAAKVPGAQFATDLDVSFSDPKGKWRVECVADHIALLGQTLHVDLFAFGWGIIEPENNWQLIAAAIGWAEQNPAIRPETVVMTVHQPRPSHPFGPSREVSIDFKALAKFRASIAEVLSAPSDEVRSGLSWCGKCPGLATCAAARGAAMNAIDYAEMHGAENPTNEELARELDALERAQGAIKYRLEALTKMTEYRVKNGEIVGNYAMMPSYGNRTWNDGLTADLLQMFAGKDLRKPGLVTPAQAVNMGVDETVIATLCHRPQRGAKLIKVDPNKRADKLLKG